MGRTGTILFFSVFLLMGSVFTWVFLFRPIIKLISAREWSKTPCTVVSSEVKSYSDSDGTTYSIQITYRYTCNGRDYLSDRYGFMDSSSSGRKRKQAVVDQYPPGREAICYVNPTNPNDAVLNRNFTPMMLIGLFPLLFVAIGAGGITWALKSSQFAKPAEGVAPWLQRPDWTAGRIKSSNKTAMWVIWGFALIWNAISWPILFLALNDENKQPARFLILLFPAAGLFLLWLALRQTKQYRQFGDSVLELTSLPGAIGGALTGKICLPQFINADDGFKLRLRCVSVHSSSDSNSESVVWEDERIVPIGGGDFVPVGFYIPPDCLETSNSDSSNRILWRLEAEAQISGSKYSSQFEVPVFKVALTREEVATAEKLRGEAQSEIAAYRMPEDSPIRIESSPHGGIEFYFPPRRILALNIFITIFFLIWTGIIVGMIYGHAPLFFPIVFGLTDLILTYAMLALWFGSWRVEVERDQVTVMRSLGLWKRVRVVPVADIAGFISVIGMTSGTAAYRDIKLTRHTGKSVTVAGSIQDHRQAEWLAAEMTRRAGIDSTNS